MNNKSILNIYFFLIFLLTSQPCNILDITSAGRPVTVLITVLFSVYMCMRFGVKLVEKRSIYIFILMAIWGLLQYICLKRRPSPFIFIELFVSYTVFSLYKNDLFRRFENVSVKLSTIALILWGICLIAYEPMLALANAVGDKGAEISQSLYIFSIPDDFNNKGFLLRNCGYSWEPGRFACMLIVALWFNIQRTNLNFRDKNFIILTLALISSQSTTGYAMYIVMVGGYYLLYRKFNPIYLIIGITLFVSAMSLPFMRNKVVELWQNTENIERNLANLEQVGQHDNEAHYVPQRFDGFIYQYMNLEHANKFIGEGRNYLNFYLNRQGLPIIASEGILNVFIRYGCIIAFLMYFSLFRSSASFSTKFRGRGKLLFPFVFIGLNFSYYLWAVPIFMTMWLWSYWNGERIFFLRRTHKQPIQTNTLTIKRHNFYD